jgi:hypothetical protein
MKYDLDSFASAGTIVGVRQVSFDELHALKPGKILPLA